MTERGDLDAVSEAIGYLRADIRNLRKTIETAEFDRRQAQRGANEHRGVIQKAVEELRGDVEQLASDLKVVKGTADSAKMVTDEVEQWRERGKGALFVSGIAGAAAGSAFLAFVAYWWDGIMKLLRSTLGS